MRRLVISEVKKRYMSLFKLREGTLLNPPKTDIKGFEIRSIMKRFIMKTILIAGNSLIRQSAAKTYYSTI